MQAWWLLYALVGWGFSEAWIVRRSLPDPPPDPLGWVLRTLAALIGGGLGAAIAHASSDPMPGHVALVGALAGAAALVGLTRAFVPAARR